MFLSSTIASTKHNGRSACHNTKSGVSVLPCRDQQFPFTQTSEKYGFFSPCVLLPLCEFARLRLSSGARRANSFLPATGSACLGGRIWGAEEWIFGPTPAVENGSCFSCAFKAVFALVALRQAPGLCCHTSSVFAPTWLVLNKIKMNMEVGSKGTWGGRYAEAEQKGGQERAVLRAPQRDKCKSNQQKGFLFFF